MNDSIVAVYKMKGKAYPSENPTGRPKESYPEYPFDEISEKKNEVYEAVRECFHLMALDPFNYGSEFWNPLGDIIKPGNTVLLKPNLVMDFNQNNDGGTECLYTQPSVVAAVIDYVVIALKGTGKIVVGDAPMHACVFNNIMNQGGYKSVIEFYIQKGINIEMVDFRELSTVTKDGMPIQIINSSSSGTVINIGEASEFYNAPSTESPKYRVTTYDPRILPQHHHGNTQEYYVSNYVLDADVVINMPKPKTHRKAGITGALKNLVGINVRKEYLPHHIKGDAESGAGDEYKDRSLAKRIISNLYDYQNICMVKKNVSGYKIANFFIKWVYRAHIIRHLGKRDVYSEGSWYGNHTISRTITDLNKILLYADKKGKLQETIQRKCFIVADVVISGEKEGPVSPSPKPVGIVAAGMNPVYFDETIATLMGFDIEKIPTLQCVRKSKDLSLASKDTSEIILKSNVKQYSGKHIKEIEKEDILNFEPTLGWKGYIEPDNTD